MLSTDKQTDKQTNRQTNQRYQKHNLLCQGGKKLRIYSYIGLPYFECLEYRFLKSLDADSVCADSTTLAYMCSLFSLMKELLEEGGVSTSNAISFDTDTIVHTKRMLSVDDCTDYDMVNLLHGDCVDTSMVYETNPK